MTESRCTGHCCQDFAISTSPEELEVSYLRWLGMSHYSNNTETDLPRGEALYRHKGLERGVPPIYTDIHLIYPMLKFVKKDYWHPDRPEDKQSHPVYHYRCVHFDDDEKKCTVYPFRPTVCRAFGRDGCGYKGCTWKEAVKVREAETKMKAAAKLEDNECCAPLK